jgi:hypothetical protein
LLWEQFAPVQAFGLAAENSVKNKKQKNRVAERAELHLDCFTLP